MRGLDVRFCHLPAQAVRARCREMRIAGSVAGGRWSGSGGGGGQAVEGEGKSGRGRGRGGGGDGEVSMVLYMRSSVRQGCVQPRLCCVSSVWSAGAICCDRIYQDDPNKPTGSTIDLKQDLSLRRFILASLARIRDRERLELVE